MAARGMCHAHAWNATCRSAMTLHHGTHDGYSAFLIWHGHSGDAAGAAQDMGSQNDTRQPIYIPSTHGHGHGGAGAHGEEQRVGRVGKLGAVRLQLKT